MVAQGLHGRADGRFDPDGPATATAERVAPGETLEVARVRITDAGQRALATAMTAPAPGKKRGGAEAPPKCPSTPVEEAGSMKVSGSHGRNAQAPPVTDLFFWRPRQRAG